MLRNAVSAYGARLSLGAAAVAAPVAVAECAKDDKKSVTSSFDPEALERGAKALREINSSVHAKRVRPNRSGLRKSSRRARVSPPRVRSFISPIAYSSIDRRLSADRAPDLSFPRVSSRRVAIVSDDQSSKTANFARRTGDRAFALAGGDETTRGDGEDRGDASRDRAASDCGGAREGRAAEKDGFRAFAAARADEAVRGRARA
jgi:hypothetical protein